MFKKMPIVSCPINLSDLLFGSFASFKRTPQETLKDMLGDYLNLKYIYYANSATASLYILLRTLKEIHNKKEVILPAYTASSLIIAIRKANLKPVLCDISLDDFNMDINLVPGLVGEETLCILGVHMFGIVFKGLEKLKKKFPDIFIIEDCAQAFGSKINGKCVGGMGDASFFSFNRGKNLPTCGGGAIATNSEALADRIRARIECAEAWRYEGREEILAAVKILLLSLAVRPHIYGMLYPLISCFKEKAPPQDFEVKRYADFQMKVALSLLKRIDAFSKKRYDNGMKLIEGLRDMGNIIIPEISKETEPGFNRLPVVFKEVELKERVEDELWKAGIESSRMYLMPLHHIFELGYKKEDFPNSTYFAERLLTLPAHPMVDEKTISKIIELIRITLA